MWVIEGAVWWFLWLPAVWYIVCWHSQSALFHWFNSNNIRPQYRCLFVSVLYRKCYVCSPDGRKALSYNRYNGSDRTCTVQLMSRCVESVLCLRAAWLLPAQHFSQSGDRQQERKALLRHKTARGWARTLPITGPLQNVAPADSWLLCLDSVLPIPVFRLASDCC